MKVFEMLLPLLKEGIPTTFLVFFITLIFSLILSLPVAILRLSKNKIISKIVEFYIYLMRATPLLLQLMFIFFGLPMISGGITLGRFSAIYLAFILNYTAYFAEILRGGIISIDKGQWEASRVLGLSKSFAFRKIIFPQVIRPVFPSIANEIITLIKDTSLVYVLGVMDILKAAKSVSNSLSTILPYIYVAFIYLVFVWVVEKILKKMEIKFQFE